MGKAVSKEEEFIKFIVERHLRIIKQTSVNRAWIELNQKEVTVESVKAERKKIK